MPRRLTFDPRAEAVASKSQDGTQTHVPSFRELLSTDPLTTLVQKIIENPNHFDDHLPKLTVLLDLMNARKRLTLLILGFFWLQNLALAACHYLVFKELSVGSEELVQDLSFNLVASILIVFIQLLGILVTMAYYKYGISYAKMYSSFDVYFDEKVRASVAEAFLTTVQLLLAMLQSCFVKQPQVFFQNSPLSFRVSGLTPALFMCTVFVRQTFILQTCLLLAGFAAFEVVKHYNEAVAEGLSAREGFQQLAPSCAFSTLPGMMLYLLLLAFLKWN